MPTRLFRQARLIELQASLGDALRETEAKRPTAAHQPALPAGMKWLVPPREALESRLGDATTMRLAFDTFLYWRLVLGSTRPTKASLVQCGKRLRALALWQLAIRAQAAGKPLPLKSGLPAYDVPATFVSQSQYDTLLAAAKARSKAQRRLRHHRLVLAETTRDDAEDNQDNQDEYTAADLAALNDTLDFWDNYGNIDQEALAGIVDPAKLKSLLGDDAYLVAGDSLDFLDLFANLREAGYSDMDIAGLVSMSWNGQAVLWAGQDLISNAGIGGSFNLTDPWFYDYLRNQSGYYISGIYDFTRADIADDLWRWMGGPGGPGLYNVQGLANAINDRYGIVLDGTTKFSADQRAYMIALTETSRAENFGNFVALYTTGAKDKIWIVNAGACQICVGNAEAGPVPLLQAFPSGVMAPPTHPTDRCAVGAAVPETFSPDDWMPRSTSDLSDLLTSWTGAAWPNVSAADMADLADLESAAEMAAQPTLTRRSAAQDYALGGQLTALMRELAVRWLREAHVRMPVNEADLRALSKRLRTPDEMPDAREADEQALHRIKTGFAEILRT